MLEVLKNLIDNYIEDEERIQSLIVPRMKLFVDQFVKYKGSNGIRLSILLSIFKPKKFCNFVKMMVKKILFLDWRVRKEELCFIKFNHQNIGKFPYKRRGCATKQLKKGTIITAPRWRMLLKNWKEN